MAQPDLHHLQQPDTEPGGCWIGKKKVTFVVHLLGWDVSPWWAKQEEAPIAESGCTVAR